MIELLYTLLIMNVLLGGGNQINHVYRYVMRNLRQGWKCIADVLTCIFYLLECSEGWCASTEMVCPADITETIQC